MPAANDLSDYLDSLPEPRRRVFDRLSAVVGAIPVPASNASFAFVAGQGDHPVFDDAQAVLWKAVEQLYLRQAASDGELPLAYWGFHSVDIFGRRHANGVLVTDRTVIVEDVGNQSAQMPLIGFDPRSVVVAGDALRVGGVAIGLEQIAPMLEDTSAVDAAGYLSRVIAAVQSAAVQGGGVHAGSSEDDAGVEEVVVGSRLSSDFLLASRPKDAKGLAKLAAKWKLPTEETLLVSLSSATFAGVYGIAITDAAVYSRELMEPVQRTPLAEVVAVAWDTEGKGFRIAPDHLAPTHPAVTDDNRLYVETLFNRLVRAAARH